MVPQISIRRLRRARRLRLSVYHTGAVTVTAPFFAFPWDINNFIRAHTEWIIKKLAYFKANPARHIDPRGTKIQFKQFKHQALVLAHQRIQHFSSIYASCLGGPQLNPNKITIRNQKTRWGSCSKSGNINFNYKIVLLPPHLRDYIIVHELCHLKEFNHSKKFWSLIQQTIPNPKALKKELQGQAFGQS